MPCITFKSYSLMLELAATCRAVPLARPPRAVTRSAIKSTASSTRSAIESNSRTAGVIDRNRHLLHSNEQISPESARRSHPPNGRSAEQSVLDGYFQEY